MKYQEMDFTNTTLNMNKRHKNKRTDKNQRKNQQSVANFSKPENQRSVEEREIVRKASRKVLKENYELLKRLADR